MEWNVNDRRSGRARCAAIGCLRIGMRAVLVLLAAASWARAQPRTTWEYSPYHVRVWLAAAADPELSPVLLARIRRTVLTETRLAAGATWHVDIEMAPEPIADSIVTSPELLTVDQIGKARENTFSNDKILLLGVQMRAGDYAASCRELDSATRTLGKIVRRRAAQVELLPYQAAGAVVDAFSALVRIEQSRGKGGTVRVRAGGLVRHNDCPSLVAASAVLRPIIRRNDRDGNPRPGGIQVLDWTYLVVRGPVAEDRPPQDAQKKPTTDTKPPAKKKTTKISQAGHAPDFLLDCEVYSAMRNPLAGRRSIRTQRLALAVRPRGDVTHLRLLSRATDPRPLEGYEIFAKKPVPKDPKIPNKPIRIGMTDWRGLIDVTADPNRLRIVYVKNGNHLIARLPIVPGYEDQQSIQLPSDDMRLETEAFVKGIESMVMDLVARRAILAARIRRRLKEGRRDDARKLLADIKTFRTRDDLEAMIANRQKTSFHSSDPREQQRIDQMLRGTRILLNKYLDPEQLVALQRQVENPGAAAQSPAKAKVSPPPDSGKATSKAGP